MTIDTRLAVRVLLQRAKAEDQQSVPALLRALAEASRDPGGDLAWFVGHDPDEEISMRATLLLFQATEDGALTDAALDRLREGASPVLTRALRSGDVPDQRKAMIGTMMHRLGVEMDPDEYHACFKDFDGAMRDLMDKGLKFDAAPGSVTALLDPFGKILDCDDGRLPADDEAWMLAEAACIRAIRDNPDAAAMLLGAVCASAIWHGHENHEGLVRAIRELAQSDSPEAMWQFQTLSHWPFGCALAETAGKAYGEMLARGVRPRIAFGPALLKGYVSSNDGSGARQLGLFFKADIGERDGVLLLLKDSWGIKEALTSYGDPSDLEMIFRRPSHEIVHAPCTLELARSLYADAVFTSRERGNRLPPNVYLCRQFLGGDHIAIEPREPDLSAYKSVMSGLSPLVTKKSAKLADTPLYGGLWFASDAAHDFVAKNGKRGTFSKAKFEEFVREVCVLERPELTRRMAVNLEVEALAGRAGKKINHVAACTWMAITSDAVPFAEIPYVRELARTAVEMLSESVRRGFRSISEANQAALERDEAMFRLLNPDADPVDW